MIRWSDCSDDFIEEAQALIASSLRWATKNKTQYMAQGKLEEIEKWIKLDNHLHEQLIAIVSLQDDFKNNPKAQLL